MGFRPVDVRSVESMTNFVCNQKVEHFIGCFSPHGKSQDTGLNVKLCGVTLLVLHDQVLCGKHTGNSTFDFVVDRHGCGLFDLNQIYEKTSRFGEVMCRFLKWLSRAFACRSACGLSFRFCSLREWCCQFGTFMLGGRPVDDRANFLVVGPDRF